AAFAWMKNYGDLDGDGLLEYDRKSTNGLANQGWKDSNDAIFHADGSLAEAPIALAEVQAYAFAAYCGGAELANALGRQDEAGQLPDGTGWIEAAFRERILARGPRHLRPGARCRQAALRGARFQRGPCSSGRACLAGARPPRGRNPDEQRFVFRLGHPHPGRRRAAL